MVCASSVPMLLREGRYHLHRNPWGVHVTPGHPSRTEDRGDFSHPRMELYLGKRNAGSSSTNEAARKNIDKACLSSCDLCPIKKTIINTSSDALWHTCVLVDCDRPATNTASSTPRERWLAFSDCTCNTVCSNKWACHALEQLLNSKLSVRSIKPGQPYAWNFRKCLFGSAAWKGSIGVTALHLSLRMFLFLVFHRRY